MNLLEGLLGKREQRDDYQDFVRRYEDGRPSEGYSDEEVAERYQQVTSQLSPEEYQSAAREAFARMDPDERRSLGLTLQEEARKRGVTGFVDQNNDGIDDRFQDPDQLATLTSKVRQGQPGLLEQVLGGALGGGGGGLLGGALGGGGGGMLGQVIGGMLGGNAAQSRSGNRSSGGDSGLGGLLSSPVAKAALAGIAAMAVKQMMNRRR